MIATVPPLSDPGLVGLYDPKPLDYGLTINYGDIMEKACNEGGDDD